MKRSETGVFVSEASQQDRMEWVGDRPKENEMTDSKVSDIALFHEMHHFKSMLIWYILVLYNMMYAFNSYIYDGNPESSKDWVMQQVYIKE